MSIGLTRGIYQSQNNPSPLKDATQIDPSLVYNPNLIAALECAGVPKSSPNGYTHKDLHRIRSGEVSTLRLEHPGDIGDIQLVEPNSEPLAAISEVPVSSWPENFFNE